MPDLETEVRRLGKEMKEIEKEILYQRNHKTGHPDDRFIQVMSDFITVASYKYSELEDKFKEMQERVCIAFNKSVKYFIKFTAQSQAFEKLNVDI